MRHHQHAAGFVVFVALVLGPVLAGQGTGAAAATAEGLEARAFELVVAAAREQQLVGVSAAIFRGNGIVVSVHEGFEDREGGVKASDATMYRWASISKPVTAVVAMQLAKEDKLDLDADVRTLVPEFPEKPWPITARQLLTHQGGVVHYTNGKVIVTRRSYDDPHPFADAVTALDVFKESPLVAEPGTTHAYTTHGYMLLGAACQRAGGTSFANLAKTRVAGKAGMTSFQPDYPWVQIPHRAKGYRKAKPGSESLPSTDTDVSFKLPGGGYISNVRDLARFGVALFGTTLVDEATRARMWTPQTTRDGKATAYGLGFGVGREKGRARVSHSGAQEKTSTFLLLLPEEAAGPVGAAVMTNTEGASLKNLASALAGLLESPPPQRSGH